MGIIRGIVADGDAIEKRTPASLKRGFAPDPSCVSKSILRNFVREVKKFKSLSLKVAVPTLILTGVWIPLGHQPIMILAGAGMTIEHRLSYGRWWDKDKRICYGKFGVVLLMVGCCIALVGIL